ncbi:Cullin family [Carpediemonas membranifera]|uniref:Cullin family n=1 Tax=Carpediemonas membranifera TaxID=201153 RepID=A0A8J6B5V1_9EUKA|nr:Cullin family [Carpediemonas membranifera]|eukprot:KAG9396303.1 Cullin family [Carpediemonas membranifera]
MTNPEDEPMRTSAGKAGARRLKAPNAGKTPQELWSRVETALRSVLRLAHSDLKFEENYSLIYQLTQLKQYEIMCNGFDTVVGEHISSVFLPRIKEALNDESDDDILTVVADCWSTHEQSMAVAQNLFFFADRQLAQTRKSTTMTRGMSLFASTVLDEPTTQALNELFKANLDAMRQGSAVSSAAMRTITHMYAVLAEKARPQLAKDVHQLIIANVSAAHAALAADQYGLNTPIEKILSLTNDSVVAESALLAGLAVNQETITQAAQAVKGAWLFSHRETLLGDDGCVRLVESSDVSALCKFAELTATDAETTAAFEQLISARIVSTGMGVLHSERRLDPIWVVTELVELLKKYETLCAAISEGVVATRLRARMYRSFQTVVDATPSVKINFNEYLALFLDSVVKLKEDCTDRVNAALDLLRFPTDKAAFLKLHAQLLARRLLGGRYTNTDAEKLAVSRLRKECGLAAVESYYTMARDISASQAIASKWRETSAVQDALQFDTRVLTKAAWPKTVVSTETALGCLPDDVAAMMGGFKIWFEKTHEHRTVDFSLVAGTAAVEVQFKPGESVQLVLSTGMYLVVDLFNSRDSIEFSDICDSLHPFPEFEVRTALLSLTNPDIGGVLIQSPAGDITKHTKFTLNTEFTSKSKRVRIPVVSPEGVAKSSSVEHQALIKQDNLIDSVIVRVMKKYRTQSYHDLVETVQAELGERCDPTVTAIKARVEGLIEFEYIRREGDDLVYVP